ncbi:MAG: hypothetical protein CM15mP68_0590 [Pseudomonadota bacterium]|nr:MAG: hypothetical protein CM15mP68_0590 [Pseudomonadota bacterium]
MVGKSSRKGLGGLFLAQRVRGSAGGLIEQTILREEMALAKAPPLGTSMMGLAWVGPGIMEYGTEEQNASSFPISWTAKSLGVPVILNPITAQTSLQSSAKPN